MTYRPHTILVTGGAGFIGSNFVRYMIQSDSDVRIVNLDKLTYAGSLNNLKGISNPQQHVFVQGDICDQSLVNKLLHDYEVDTIVHFAAESHVDRSIAGPREFVRTNIMGTFTLLDAACQFWLDEKGWNGENCRFHHISTDEVYGALGPHDLPFTEITRYAPNSPYSATKAGSDHLVRAWRHTYGLPLTMTNCSNNYGPFQHPEKFIPTVIRSCVEGEPIPVYGNGTNIRDWLYVDDHCQGIDAVIRKGSVGEVYNIGGDNEWANIDICHAICNMMDELRPENKPHANLISFVKDRPGHDWRYAINADKVKTMLGWTPSETFTTGIRKTIEWYLQNGFDV